MKIDLAINLASLDPTEWDFQVWLVVMLLTQAFAFFMWIRRDMKREDKVERLVRDRHFGGV